MDESIRARAFFDSRDYEDAVGWAVISGGAARDPFLKGDIHGSPAWRECAALKRKVQCLPTKLRYRSHKAEYTEFWSPPIARLLPSKMDVGKLFDGLIEMQRGNNETSVGSLQRIMKRPLTVLRYQFAARK